MPGDSWLSQTPIVLPQYPDSWPEPGISDGRDPSDSAAVSAGEA